MKKLIISLILLIPFVSGCGSFDTRLTINPDKSATLVTSLTYKGNLADKGDSISALIDSKYQSYLDEMYTTENVYGKKLSTITATKSVKNLELSDIDLSSLGFKTNLESKKFIDIKKNFLITSYNIDATYNLKEQINKLTQKTTSEKITSEKGLVPEYYQKYGADVDDEEVREDFLDNLDDDAKELIVQDVNPASDTKSNNAQDKNYTSTFSIQVPSFASANNADSVEGNIYTWNLKKNEPVNIKFQYVKYNGWTIMFVILIGIALIGLLARRIVKRESQKQLDANK